MKIGNKSFEIGKRTYIMGSLNVTPDSFSDGGRYDSVDRAMIRAKEMIADGVDIIDIGGESTRPGYVQISDDEEIQRVIPVIEAIRQISDIAISVDSYKSNVIEASLDAGADMINDIWGFKKDESMARLAKKYDAACVLMHNRDNCHYNHISEDMILDLSESIEIAIEGGVDPEKIIIDPGIGFAKTYEQNLMVMNNLEAFSSLGYPLLLAASRKRMIGTALNLNKDKRLEGTLATTAIGIMKKCDFVRVNDITENKRVALMTDAIIRNNI